MLKKDLGSFVKELQSAITDPKVQAFLMAAKEDGATDDDVIRIQQNEVPVLSLIPTQNEVFLEKSLNWPFNKQPENIVSYIRDAKGSMLPIIVSGNYVIDGHHRWSQIFCLNPKGVIPVYNITFEGKSDPTTILKKIHLGIAATRKELPTTGGQSTDTDLFKVAQDGFAKWIHANLDNNEAALKSFKIVEAEMKSKLQEADDAAAAEVQAGVLGHLLDQCDGVLAVGTAGAEYLDVHGQVLDVLMMRLTRVRFRDRCGWRCRASARRRSAAA
jgi:hypothetical protein